MANHRKRTGSFEKDNVQLVEYTPSPQPELEDLAPGIKWHAATHGMWERLVDYPTMQSLPATAWDHVMMLIALPYNNIIQATASAGRASAQLYTAYRDGCREYGLTPRALNAMKIEMLTSSEMEKRQINSNRTPGTGRPVSGKSPYKSLRPGGNYDDSED